jgi:aarF domain-containing kinase
MVTRSGMSLLCVWLVQTAGASAFVAGGTRLWTSPAASRALALRGPRHVRRAAPGALRRSVTMQQRQASTRAGSTTVDPSIADWPELQRLQPFGDNRTPEEILRDGQKLVEEGYKLALETPPEVGLRRTLQASRAVLKTGTELLRKFQKAGRAPTTDELIEEVPSTLRRLFELLGATYIKLGQFIASSPTLFPAEYVKEFQKCLDNTEPVPFARIKRVIEKDLRIKDLSEVFLSVDEKPLATASIAQVHAAKLKTGEDVVIKVQKPGVDSLLTADLAFVTFATRVVEFLNPELRRLSLADITGDIRTTMLDELDFKKEAKNMAEFRTFLAASGNTEVMCPEVFPGASGSKVLTMQRLYGRPLVDLDAIRAYCRGTPEQTLISALNTWTASVIGCSSFHADVHAGNLLVLQDGRIAFIDFGIVGKISPKTWQALEGIIQGFAENDFELMASALVRLGATGDRCRASMHP